MGRAIQDLLFRIPGEDPRREKRLDIHLSASCFKNHEINSGNCMLIYNKYNPRPLGMIRIPVSHASCGQYTRFPITPDASVPNEWSLHPFGGYSWTLPSWSQVSTISPRILAMCGYEGPGQGDTQRGWANTDWRLYRTPSQSSAGLLLASSHGDERGLNMQPA